VTWPAGAPVDLGPAGVTDPVGLPRVLPEPPAPDPERPPDFKAGRRRAGRDGRPVKKSRAGRNLPAAIAVGVGLGALVLVPLFLYPLAFLGVIALATGVGIWEMARAVRAADAHPPLVPLLVGGLLMVGLAWFAGPDALSLGLLVTVLATMVWRIGDGPSGFQRDLVAATLITVYVPFLGGFAALLAAGPDGAVKVVAALLAVVLSDTGGYAAGVWLGRHPMAPSISPKKSWEGLGGSVTAAALGSAALLWWQLDVAPWWGALFGVAVSAAAVLGDLGESMIKRDLGVKDMSNLLPGHGGLMDRLDSVLFAVPVAYLLLAVLAPTG
jgi:phosphatidate cytidylyltransferase